MFKTAIIGTGWIAGGYDNDIEVDRVRTHALAYKQNPETRLISVADSDIEKAKAFSEKWQLTNYYKNADDMLESVQPDIVSICSPDNTHIDYLRACLEYSSIKAVWCEKPLALSPDGLESLLSDYKSAAKVLLINYQRNFALSYREIAADIKSQKYGLTQKIIIYYTKGIMHNGSHAISLLYEWFGEPDSIQLMNAFIDSYQDDPTVDVCLHYKNFPVYLMGLDEEKYSFFEIQMFFANAQMVLSDFGTHCKLVKVNPETESSGHKVLLKDGQQNSMSMEKTMSYVLDTILNAMKESKININGTQSLRVLETTHDLAQQGLALLQNHE